MNKTRPGFISKILAGFWRRIFLATLLLVLLSQAVYVFLLYLDMSRPDEWRAKISDYIGQKIKTPLMGRDVADADIYLSYFNIWGPQLWFESLDGEAIAGEAVAGLTFEERKDLKPPLRLPNGDLIWWTVTDWETGPDSPVEMLATPVDFKTGPALLCYTYWRGDFPYLSQYFTVGLAVLVAVSALLSYAVARHLARPLKKLQYEVLEIDGENIGRRVTIQGPREIADVAQSVNALTESLEQHVLRMKELMANVSHELRSPLMRLDFAFTFMERGLFWAWEQIDQAKAAGFNPSVIDAENDDQDDKISGRLKQLMNGPDESSTAYQPLLLATKYLGYYREELKHMESLIGACLLSSKLDLHRGGLNKKIFDISELCLAMVGEFRPLAEARGYELSCEVIPKIQFYGETFLIRQAVTNLFDNAIKYTTPKGRIIFKLMVDNCGRQNSAAGGNRSGRGIRLELENSFGRVSESGLSGLFTPFFRLEPGQHNGVGLGLSLVKKIVELHQGKTSAENTSMGIKISIAIPSAVAKK
jgi:signal transduction histidine kinase